MKRLPALKTIMRGAGRNMACGLLLALGVMPVSSSAEQVTDDPLAPPQGLDLQSLPRPGSVPANTTAPTPVPVQNPAVVNDVQSIPHPSYLPPTEGNVTPVAAQSVMPAPAATLAPAATPAPMTIYAPAATPAQPAVDNTTLIHSVSNKITVSDMGQPNGLTLSGGQLQSGIVFTLPNDQVITDANLSLVLKVSPALVARDTSLELMLNGQPLGTLPLTGSGSSDKNEYELDIPAAMVVSSNNLSFRVQDSNTMECQKDQSDKYWVTIMPATHVQMDGQRLNIGRDLGYFPRPFFDPLQMQETKVAMVFTSALKPQDVSAAAMVASYLGMLSDYRNVDFPVSLGDLPEQNGIVFGRPGDRIGTLVLPASEGASVQIIDNPSNPVYKLLLVLGNDENQLRQAAYRLISSPLPEKTNALSVPLQQIPMREPYDAPRWIDTDKPVTLGSLVHDNEKLTANGIYHDGIRVAFRAAPDLFMWDGDTIPVQIGYRFPTENWIDEDRSQMNVSINGTFLRDLTVNKNGLFENAYRKLGGDSRQESYRLQLAPYLIYGDNQLEFYFDIKPKADAPCNLLTSNNIKSRIDPNSYIDLSHTHHFSLLPNLSYYVGASFPFSKLADFSQTLLLLPEKPDVSELSTMLGLVARSGNATGVPVSHVKVVFGLQGNEAGNPLFSNSDVLAVTTLDDQKLSQQLLQGSPFTLNNNVLGVIAPSQIEKAKSWLIGDWFRSPVDADRYLSSTEAWRGFLSFPSQWGSKRVVVVATATNGKELQKIHADLKSSSINAGIRGDLAIVTDENGIRSFRVGSQFPTGQLPWYMMFVWYASEHIVLLSLLSLLFSALIGLSIYTLLARHAAKRLPSRQAKKNEKE